MSGNVWEWCLNEHDRPQHTSLSGTARRVVRGGSWSGGQVSARASSRGDGAPGGRGSYLGLRVVRSSPSLA
jgi:formylglycine-generating enzyme required for sulfatase activity